jgi:hypothetical protein
MVLAGFGEPEGEASVLSDWAVDSLRADVRDMRESFDKRIKFLEQSAGVADAPQAAAVSGTPPSCTKVARPEVRVVTPRVCTPGSTEPAGKPHGKYAYCNIISYCTTNKGAYMGYIYHALLSKLSLKKLGSTADFVVLIHFEVKDDRYDYKGGETPERLPEEVEELLLSNGIQVRYINNWEKMQALDAGKFHHAMLYKV